MWTGIGRGTLVFLVAELSLSGYVEHTSCAVNWNITDSMENWTNPAHGSWRISQRQQSDAITPAQKRRLICNRPLRNSLNDCFLRPPGNWATAITRVDCDYSSQFGRNQRRDAQQAKQWGVHGKKWTLPFGIDGVMLLLLFLLVVVMAAMRYQRQWMEIEIIHGMVNARNAASYITGAWIVQIKSLHIV